MAICRDFHGRTMGVDWVDERLRCSRVQILGVIVGKGRGRESAVCPLDLIRCGYGVDIVARRSGTVQG